MTHTNGKPLVPITREFLRQFYQKYPLEPVPVEALETHMRNVDGLAEDVTKQGSKVPEQFGMTTPTRIDDCFWRNRMICEELALSLSKLKGAFADQPAMAAACERCRDLLVNAERAIFAVQDSNTSSVKAQLQQFIPQDFRGALLERQRLSSEARYKKQIEDLVKRGGSIRQKYDMYLQQQWERRQSLVQLGECSGMFKMVIKWVAGIPQVLLDFAKQINAKLGPMEEQRIKYGPDLYGITTLGVRLDVCLAAWAESAAECGGGAAASVAGGGRLVEVVEPAVQFYCEHMLRVIRFIGDVFQHSPFFVSKEDIEAGQGGAVGDGGEDVVSVRASSSTTGAVAAAAEAGSAAAAAAAAGGQKKDADVAAPSLTSSASSGATHASDVGSLGAAAGAVAAAAVGVDGGAGGAGATAPATAVTTMAGSTPAVRDMALGCTAQSPAPVLSHAAASPPTDAAAAPSGDCAPSTPHAGDAKGDDPLLPLSRNCAAESHSAGTSTTPAAATPAAASAPAPSAAAALHTTPSGLPPRHPSLVHVDTPPPRLLSQTSLASCGSSHRPHHGSHGPGGHGGQNYTPGGPGSCSRVRRSSHASGRSSFTGESCASFTTAEDEQPWFHGEEGCGHGCGSHLRTEEEVVAEEAEQPPVPLQEEQRESQQQPKEERELQKGTAEGKKEEEYEPRASSKGGRRSSGGGCFGCFRRQPSAHRRERQLQQQQPGKEAGRTGAGVGTGADAASARPGAGSQVNGSGAGQGAHSAGLSGDVHDAADHLNPIAE